MSKKSNEIAVTQQLIESRIFTIRHLPVMIDRDLAELYGVETKRLNEQVKRNIERFPDTFRFQLTETERDELVANCDRLANLKHSSAMPYAFTEQGVAMLSAVLRSDTAVKVSIRIMQAFVEMRKFLMQNAQIFERLDRIETKQLETDKKFEQVFRALESKHPQHDKGIFFDGQVFDAWVFISNLVKKAHSSLILIDNYVDETVLALFAKKKKQVSVSIYTQNITRALQEDAKKFNAQYGGLSLHRFEAAHDRFLLIDKTEVYHIGASLKDLGKKWFAFSKMEKDTLTVFQKLGI
jgi:phage regulator Rha-like protein